MTLWDYNFFDTLLVNLNKPTITYLHRLSVIYIYIYIQYYLRLYIITL